MIEAEVSSRKAEYLQITRFFQRHPFIHFAVHFSYWFTAVTILDDLQARLGQLWPAWPQDYRYSFAFSCAVIFYISSRFRMWQANCKAREKIDVN
jgi:hypothetical protein